jgi:hypothetical protein
MKRVLIDGKEPGNMKQLNAMGFAINQNGYLPVALLILLPAQEDHDND